MRSLFASVLLVMLAGCMSQPQEPTPRAVAALQPLDPGGFFYDYLSAVHVAKARRESVPIKGGCFSACVLKLASGPGVCVAPDARLAVHEVRDLPLWGPQHYALGTRNEALTALSLAVLPPCARDLFVSRGGFQSGTPVKATGAEILAACPQISACH